MNDFKVNENEIPEQITVHLGMNERALFARMLTAYKFSVEDAGDTFEHILKQGLRKTYEDQFGTTE
jgi:hypothetical protein